MKDQHKKISGYRDLTQAEIDLMNEAKELEARVLEFHRKVGRRLVNEAVNVPGEEVRQEVAKAHRWLDIGRTDIETGFMAIVRAIAQPQPIRLEE